MRFGAIDNAYRSGRLSRPDRPLGASRQTIRANLISAGLTFTAIILLCTSVLNLLNIGDSVPSFMLYAMALCIWLRQVRRRLMHPIQKQYMLAGGILTLSLLLVRTWRYSFIWKTGLSTGTVWLHRHAWYMYYILEVLFAACFFLGILSGGEPCRQAKRKWRNLIGVCSVMLCILVFANDQHQLMFRFLNPELPWTELFPYSYGILYYITMVWLAFLFLVTILLSLVRCATSEFAGQIWKPLIPVFFCVIYFLLLIYVPDFPTTKILRFPDMLCLFNVTFSESLILARLIPSNDNYHLLWNASSIRGGIMDQRGNIVLHSVGSPDVTLEQVIKSLSKEVSLQNSNPENEFLLGSMAIQGGYAYWTRDVSEIRNRRKKLEETGDVLREENVLLEAENRLKQEQIAAQEQNELYQQLSQAIQKQNGQIRILLQKAREQTEEESFQTVMSRACVLNAYVKRYSNLFLSGKNNDSVSTGELALAVEESFNYLRLGGIRAAVYADGEGLCSGSLLLEAYEFLEEIIESSLERLQEIQARLKIRTERQARVPARGQISPFLRLQVDTTDTNGQRSQFSYQIEEADTDSCSGKFSCRS